MSFFKVSFVLALALLFQGASFASYEKKVETFKTKIDKRMVKLDKNLDRLEDKIEDAEGKARYKLKNTYGNLIALKNKLEYEVDELNKTSEQKWDEAVDQIENMAEDIESQLDKAL